MHTTTILLVDDEPAITLNLAAFLDRSGFTVVVAADGQAALALIVQHNPQIVVLDVLMPRLDGRAVLRMLRQASNWTPVILLTQVGESSERAMALEEGADDYLNKPFDPQELVARIRAVLRRAQHDQPSLATATRIRSGALVLDRRACRVLISGQDVTLTPKAITLLDYLMTHADEVLDRDRLLDVVWGWDYATGTRAVDSRIAELRRGLNDTAAQPTYIETLPGQGYRFIGIVEAAV